MANVNLKTDFKDGDKLFAQQLNNNFGAIKAALEAMNKIVWQDDPDDMVSTFRGTTEEINNRDIIDGQLLYDTTTGETYIDYGSQRISTGSGNAIFIGDTEPTNPSTQLWVDPTTPLQTIGSEVVNSLSGNESNKAPSVNAINTFINPLISYSEEETVVGKWFGKPLYRKTVHISSLPNDSEQGYDTGIPKATTTYRFAYGMYGGFPINFYYGYSPTLSISTYLREDNSVSQTNWVIDIYTGADRSSLSGYVHVYYTKTTD